MWSEARSLSTKMEGRSFQYIFRQTHQQCTLGLLISWGTQGDGKVSLFCIQYLKAELLSLKKVNRTYLGEAWHAIIAIEYIEAASMSQHRKSQWMWSTKVMLSNGLFLMWLIMKETKESATKATIISQVITNTFEMSMIEM